jgi:hypothetical protein
MVDYETKEEMVHSIYAELISKYYILNGEVLRYENMQMNLYYDYYINVYTHPQSQIPIRPPVDARNNASSTGIFPDLKIRGLVKRLFDHHLVYNLKIPVPKKKLIGIQTLRYLAYDVCSYESIVYKDYKGMPRVRFATNNAGELAVQLKLYSEFNVNGALRGPSFGELRKILPGALRLLEGALDCEKFVGTFDFFYHPESIIDFCKLGTSGGVVAVPMNILTLNGTRYRVMNAGKKLHLFEPAARQFHKYMCQLLRGGNPIFEFLCVMKLKQEWRIGHNKNEDELRAMQTKCREFFIAGMLGIFLSHLLMNKRMFIERGNMIRIGMKFIYGGAYELAKYMRYDVEDMIYVTGDIKNLDKHIKDWQLMLYILTGQRYFRWNKYSRKKERFVRRLFRILAYNIAHKVVLHVGGFWRFMRGFMYSGGKETSAGNSWILCLAFFCYLIYTVMKFPHLKQYVDRFLVLKLIVIIAYGDDHIWVMPGVLREYFNKFTWTKFLEEFYDMELREGEQFDSFMSEFDHVTGMFIKKGPKFLKRYFVKNRMNNGLAPVLPVKPTDETMIRMVCNDNQEPHDYLMTAQGMGWDSLGTNIAVYENAKWFFNQIKLENPTISPLHVYQSYMNDKARFKKLNDLSRKLSIPIETIINDFPTIKRLQELHVHDPQRCKFGGILEEYDTVLSNMTMVSQ